MKNIIFIIAVALTYSCAKKTNVTVTEVGPRISEGYYAINNPDQYNMPLVAVKIVNGNADSYGFLKFQCQDKTYQSYDYAGTTFSDRPAFLAGRSVNLLSRGCKVETEITAESDTSIKIKVNFNGKQVDSYTLTKVTKEHFVQDLSFFVGHNVNLVIEETICQKSLGSTCDVLK